MCGWVRDLGKIPYVRLMLRSDVDQKHGEKSFSLENIIAGQFDVDLRAWARDAKAFGSPDFDRVGDRTKWNWFSWNGKWNGGSVEGTEAIHRRVSAHVDLMRSEGADNLTWVWHAIGMTSRNENGTRSKIIFQELIIAIGLRSAPTDRPRRGHTMGLKF